MKFDDLCESILGGSKKASLPYRLDTENKVVWTRKRGNLKGAPKTSGHFDCDNMELTSLEGAPEKTYGYFSCARNPLVTLEGSPRIVGGDFFCHDCNLESLEGGPEKVTGCFYCFSNPLKSLKGIPEAESYSLPNRFTDKDVAKEIKRRELVKGLDTETRDTFGDFIEEL